MPELPEVETVRVGLEYLEGATVQAVDCARRTLRYPLPDDFEQLLLGRTLIRAERVAKYLLLRFADDAFALVHLGMSGQCLLYRTLPNERAKHDHIVIDWSDPDHHTLRLVYRDPRRFGYWMWLNDPQQYPAIAHLGREAIFTEGTSDFARGRGVADALYLQQALSRRQQAIKISLLDQAVIAGLGNIYVSEALWRAGIHPDSVSCRIPLTGLEALTKAIRSTLQLAIEAGGSSLRDYVNSSGNSGYFQHDWQVYQRANQACRYCGAVIVQSRHGGRSSFFCPKHQQLFN